MAVKRHYSRTMARYTHAEAKEGDDFESFYLCSKDSLSEAAGLDITVKTEEGPITLEAEFLESGGRFDREYGHDEKCLVCGYSPADEDHDEEDED